MISKDIDLAADLLKRGEVIAIPTETVYGLAANIYDSNAIEKIFLVKQRPKNDPLIVHIHDAAQLEEIVYKIPENAKILMKKFWPGPLTFLLKKNEKISDDITSGSNFVAVRMPNHNSALELLSKVNFPLAAPSANLFQKTSPTTPLHVQQQIGEKIPLILDGGDCTVGVESTIIGFDESDDKIINIFRLGGISVEKIQEETNCKIIIKSGVCNLPGNSKLHYSTNKPLSLGDINELLEKNKNKKIGVLSFKKKYDVDYQIILSEKGNLNEAAKNLYKSMKILDSMPIEIILAELVPDENLGRAINDRLKRASF